MNEHEMFKLASAFKIQDTEIFQIVLASVGNKLLEDKMKIVVPIGALSKVARLGGLFSQTILRVQDIYAFQLILPNKATEGSRWIPEKKMLAYIIHPRLTDVCFFQSSYKQVLDEIKSNVPAILECMVSIFDCHDKKLMVEEELLQSDTPDERVVLVFFLTIYYCQLFCHSLFTFQPRHDVGYKSSDVAVFCVYLLFYHLELLKKSTLESIHFSILIRTNCKYNKNLWIPDSDIVPFGVCVKLDSYLQENIRKEEFKRRAIFQGIYDIVLMIVAFRRDLLPSCWPVISANKLEYLTELKSLQGWKKKKST